eukprot:scaffold22.g6088.t1
MAGGGGAAGDTGRGGGGSGDDSGSGSGGGGAGYAGGGRGPIWAALLAAVRALLAAVGASLAAGGTAKAKQDAATRSEGSATSRAHHSLPLAVLAHAWMALVGGLMAAARRGGAQPARAAYGPAAGGGAADCENPSQIERVVLMVEPSPFTYTSGVSTRFRATAKEMAAAGCEARRGGGRGGGCWRRAAAPAPITAACRCRLGLSSRIYSAIKEHRPHVIFCTSPGALPLAAWLYSRLLNVPLVVSYHTDVPHYLGRMGLGWLAGPTWGLIRASHRPADLTMTVSPVAAGDLVHRGVCSPDAVKVVVVVGRVSDEKNVALLKPLLDAVLERVPGARLAIAGEGPAKQAGRAGSRCWCWQRGGRGDGQRAPCGCGRRWPYMVGRPGVASALFSPGDAAAAAREVAWLAADPEARRRMAAAARAEMEACSWTSATREILREYYPAVAAAAAARQCAARAPKLGWWPARRQHRRCNTPSQPSVPEPFQTTMLPHEAMQLIYERHPKLPMFSRDSRDARRDCVRGASIAAGALDLPTLDALRAMPRLCSVHISRLSTPPATMVAYMGAVWHLSHLTGLQSLDLSFDDLGEAHAAALTVFTGLQNLIVGDNNFGAAGVEPLARLTEALTGLTSLWHLDVAYCGVGDAGAQPLARLTGLLDLSIADNLFGPGGLQHLAGLTGLQRLDVSNNLLGDIGAQCVARLTRLRHLDVEGCRIGPQGARHIARLTGLLDLSKP